MRPCWKASNSGSNAPWLDPGFDLNVCGPYEYTFLESSRRNLPEKDLDGILSGHVEEFGRRMSASGIAEGHLRAHRERRPWRVYVEKGTNSGEGDEVHVNHNLFIHKTAEAEAMISAVRNNLCW